MMCAVFESESHECTDDLFAPSVQQRQADPADGNAAPATSAGAVPAEAGARCRSRDLVVEANEHGVEVWRRDWAVRVPWGDTAKLVDIDSATVRPARTTAYPTPIAFGSQIETGTVLSCGVELDGANALAFVAPVGSSVTPDVTLPPSGWLDPYSCLSHETDNFRNCSLVWLEMWQYSRMCGRLFELAAPPDGTAVAVVPAWIQADLERLELRIQPAVDE